jgi:uncharacterized membrane protein
MKKYFLTGLVTLLPLAVTVWAAKVILNFLTKPFIGLFTHLTHSWPIPESLARVISQLLILVGLFLFVLLLGLVARWFFFNSLLKLGDRILHKIPLVKTIYKTTKDIIVPLFGTDMKTFQQVVMVSFPQPDSYVLGLVARDAPQTCSDLMNKEMISVFLPTTPNPTTGYLILRPREELIFLDMQTEEALKYIISCGVVSPEHFPRTP